MKKDGNTSPYIIRRGVSGWLDLGGGSRRDRSDFSRASMIRRPLDADLLTFPDPLSAAAAARCSGP